MLNFVMSESCVEDRWSRHWTKDVAKMHFFFIVDPDNASHHFRLLHPGNSDYFIQVIQRSNKYLSNEWISHDKVL